MIGDRTTWSTPAAGGTVTARPITAAPRLRSKSARTSIRPWTWPSKAPVALATALISFAVVLYVVQANHVSVLQFNLAQIQAQRVQLAEVNAQLYVQAQRLRTPQRVETLAVRQLHMVKTNLTDAVWIRVPATTTTSNRMITSDPPVSVGPLGWMEAAIHTVASSL